MQTVLIVLHLMVVIALVGTVLLQRSEGGALGVGGGGGFMTGRGQANALTRATAILATLFFLTSLALTILANYTRAPKSIIDQGAPTTQQQPAGPLPAGTTPLDELKKIEQQRSGGTAPAPATPAPAEPGAPAAPATPAAPAAPAAPSGPDVPKSE